MKKWLLKTVLENLSVEFKVTIASIVITFLALGYLKMFMIDEIQAYVDPRQSMTDQKFIQVIQHNSNQFKLLKSDIDAIKRQNDIMLEIQLKNRK